MRSTREVPQIDYDCAFIGYRSKMASVRIIHKDKTYLLVGMTLHYKMLFVVCGLLFGPGMTLLEWHRGWLAHLDAQSWTALAELGINAFGWFLLLRSIVFDQRIEIDALAQTIKLIQRGLRPKTVVLTLVDVKDVVIERVIRDRSEESPNNPANQVTCWILRLIGRDGTTRPLVETTEESIVKVMREFLLTAVSASADHPG